MAKISKISLFKRGFMGKCPNCGHGHLFGKYLKQTKNCQKCHADFSNITPDDAPAWATILIAGHIITFIMLYVVQREILPFWGEVILLTMLTISLVLLILPRVKGIFINLIWYHKQF